MRGLRASAGRTEVLRGVSFEVEAGEVVGLVGESGSGKSFTALSLAGLLPSGCRVTSGSVELDGQELSGLDETAYGAVRGARIGMVYQDPMTSLNPMMRIGNQVAEALTAHGRPADEARARTREVLDEVGLPAAVVRAYPHQLSGGMRQRALIATALAAGPSVLVADEPTTALDVTVQAQLLDLVDRLRDEHGLTVIWITHDLGVLARLADRVLVMYAGRIVESASVSDVFAAPQHPYTDGLLRSIPPDRGDRLDELVQIGGQPPEPGDLPGGCSFHPRCPQRRDRCTTEEPGLIDRGRSQAACWVPRAEWTDPQPGGGDA